MNVAHARPGTAPSASPCMGLEHRAPDRRRARAPASACSTRRSSRARSGPVHRTHLRPVRCTRPRERAPASSSKVPAARDALYATHARVSGANGSVELRHRGDRRSAARQACACSPHAAHERPATVGPRAEMMAAFAPRARRRRHRRRLRRRTPTTPPRPRSRSTCPRGSPMAASRRSLPGSRMPTPGDARRRTSRRGSSDRSRGTGSACSWRAGPATRTVPARRSSSSLRRGASRPRRWCSTSAAATGTP